MAEGIDYNQKTVLTERADELLLEKTIYFQYRTFKIKEFPESHSERFCQASPAGRKHSPALSGAGHRKPAPPAPAGCPPDRHTECDSSASGRPSARPSKTSQTRETQGDSGHQGQVGLHSGGVGKEETIPRDTPLHFLRGPFNTWKPLTLMAPLHASFPLPHSSSPRPSKVILFSFNSNEPM